MPLPTWISNLLFNFTLQMLQRWAELGSEQNLQLCSAKIKLFCFCYDEFCYMQWHTIEFDVVPWYCLEYNTSYIIICDIVQHWLQSCYSILYSNYYHLSNGTKEILTKQFWGWSHFPVTNQRQNWKVLVCFVI